MKQLTDSSLTASSDVLDCVGHHPLLAAQDWSQSLLGAPDGWPQELCNTVSLLLGSQIAMFVAWGPQLCVVYNEAYARMLGVKHPAALGQPMASTWAEIWNNVAPIVEQTLAGRTQYFEDLPLTVLRKEFPEQAWFTFSYSPIWNAHGEVGGIFCTVVETTLRILSERRHGFQLGMADLMRTLTEPETIMPAAVDMLGRHLQVARALHAEVDDLCDTYTIRHQWHQPEVSAIENVRRSLDDFGPEIAGALRLGRMVMIDDVARDARSSPQAELCCAMGIRAFFMLPLLKAGRLVGIFGMHQARPYHWSGTDILLSQDMVERTWSAMERAHAETSLRDAARRKDEFLAMLAHELRNPLAPISAAAELMGLVELDADRLRHTSQVIMRQVRHMTDLVDDLLDVSRVTRGLVSIRKTPQELQRLAANAVEQVRPIIAKRGHDLRLAMPAQPAYVCGDPKRLVQIITNLLNNAAKYTPDGGHILMELKVNDSQVALSITDDGLGIPASLQSHVFELFAQAERTPDRSQGGLGVGLALVKSLAELHEGSVSCHSEGLGHGSTFTVTLPRLPDDTPLPERRKSLRKLVKTTQSLRLLVVDDNTDAAVMLSLFLKELGHEVFVEHDAWKVEHRMRELEPDVCMLDIGLPGLDGYQLVTQLRQMPEAADIRMIAITGYGQEHDRSRALDAGFDHHLVKPVDSVRLVALLESIRA